MRRVQRPVQVTVSGGRLSRVRWSSAEWRPPGRSGTAVNHRVARVVDEWRVDGRWWAEEVHRDYYLLELDGGTLVELYREGENWCLTGMAD